MDLTWHTGYTTTANTLGTSATTCFAPSSVSLYVCFSKSCVEMIRRSQRERKVASTGRRWRRSLWWRGWALHRSRYGKWVRDFAQGILGWGTSHCATVLLAKSACKYQYSCLRWENCFALDIRLAFRSQFWTTLRFEMFEKSPMT